MAEPRSVPGVPDAVGLTAASLAAALGKTNRPTEQQQAVIEAPLAPALVVAGAGSGKTTTMADRIAYLVATGRAAPSQILGLTFTRKATAELNQRITAELGRVVGCGYLAEINALDRPVIKTYNSFASMIFREHALLVGWEPEAELLGEAGAWRLARQVVVSSDDARLAELGASLNSVTDAVLGLSRSIAENLGDADEVRRYAERFLALNDLPFTSGKAKATPYKSVLDAVAAVGALDPLLSLAARYAEEKKRRGLMEYSDQVSLALTICRRMPEVVDQLRARHPVVILDEYQDTSVLQTELLSTLFRDSGVMAVGDPHQSIYGWRGASAGNMARFARDFSPARPAAQFSLSVSWRNDASILRLANRLIEPLHAASVLPVLPLQPRSGASEGSVRTVFTETIETEADAVAGWLKDRLAERAMAGPPASAAILFRARRSMAPFARALETAGVPHRVLGLGGLLSAPEVVDLVSALRVLHDPSAGSALIRLLAGARWQLGVRDLYGLAALARWLSKRDHAQKPLSERLRNRARDSVAGADEPSLIDALDMLHTAPNDHTMLHHFSAEGLARLREAGALFARLRRAGRLGLSDLVRLVEEELGLDIEVMANPALSRGTGNLAAFRDELAGFLASDEHGTLGSFLGWLDRAEQRDDLAARTEKPEEGVVQLITAHGAKGLEWDLVAVPRLVQGEFPADSREGKGWLRFGALPYDFLGDAADRPRLGWQGAASQQDFDQEVKRFSAELATRHQREERRIGYVALTRARSELLLSGSFWANTLRPQKPGFILTELAAAGLIDELPEGPAEDENPRVAAHDALNWPLDPLGNRRAELEQAAAAVRAAMAAAPNLPALWQREIEVLLAERREQQQGIATIALPARVAASRFKDYLSRPSEVAEQLRRPMPERPYRQTRLGTLFHAWVQERSEKYARAELIDAEPDELDPELLQRAPSPDDAADLARLQEIFEQSPWASLRPEEVELEIQLPLAGRTIICKLDAVYRTADGYQIVDWKTGKGPRDDADLAEKRLQLDLYRLAFAEWKGIDPAEIDAVFYYVAEDRVIRPQRVCGRAELADKWRDALG